MYKIEMVEHSDTQYKLDVLMTSCMNHGVGCNLSPCGSNAKNKNKSPMLIPNFISF